MSFATAAIISAGIAGAGSLFNIGSGMVQAARGKKILKNLVEPVYRRPSEASNALALTENNYLNGGMPGAAMAENQMSGVSANALEAAAQGAGSGGDLLDALTKIDYQTKQRLNELALEKINYKQQQQQAYLAQLAQNAAYADKEFEINKLFPYRNKLAQAQALIGAGNTNIGAGINQLSNLGAGLATSYANNNLINETYPGNKLVVNPKTGKTTR